MQCGQKKQTQTMKNQIQKEDECKKQKEKEVDFAQLMFIKNAPLTSLPNLTYFFKAFIESQKKIA